MIGQPFNDHSCLGPASQLAQALCDERDPVLVELAQRYPTIDDLITYYRSLPQRDDLGDPYDGPRFKACNPSQRLVVGSNEPNCFERSVGWIAAAELIDPRPHRQLATVNTPIGMHTLPLQDGEPVILNPDPELTRERLKFGLTISAPGPVSVEPRNAIDWTIDLAGQRVGAVRNGPSAYPIGRRAIHRLINEGLVPSPREVESMGVLFAVAEYAADRYGARAMGIVRTAARAISDVLDVVLAHHHQRNAHLDIGGLKFNTPGWLDQTADALGHFGLDVGGAVARSKLDAYDIAGLIGLPGGTAGLLGLLESELNKQGRTLGTVAHPPQLTTFSKFAAPTTG
jgi:hypothetical protein